MNSQLNELQELLAEFCISGEHAEFTHINKVCNVPPEILGILMEGHGDFPVPSLADRGRKSKSACVTARVKTIDFILPFNRRQ